MWAQVPKAPAAVMPVGLARFEPRHMLAEAGLFSQPQRQAEPSAATAQDHQVQMSRQRRPSRVR